MVELPLRFSKNRMQNQSQTFFSLGLTEHRHWGFIFVPYLLERIGESPIYKIVENLHGKEQTKAIELSDTEKQLLKLVNEYNEKNLVKLFSKQKNQKEFMAQLTPEFLAANIRPYIERRIIKCVELLQQCATPIYQQSLKLTNFYEEERLIIESSKAHTLFSFERNNDGTKYSLSITFKDEELKLGKTSTILTNSPCLIKWDKRLMIVDGTDGKKLQPFLSKAFITIPASAERQYFSSFVLNTIKAYPVRAKGFTIDTEKCAIASTLTLEQTVDGKPMACVRFQYNYNIYFANVETAPLITLTFFGDAPHYTRLERDHKREKELLMLIEEMGFIHYDGPYYLSELDAPPATSSIKNLTLTLGAAMHTLQGAGFKIQNKLNGHKPYLGYQELDLRFATTGDGFKALGGIKMNNGYIGLLEIKSLLEKNADYIPLENGERLYIPDRDMERLRPMFYFGREEEGELRLSRHHFQLVDDSLEVDKEEMAKLRSYENLPQLVGNILPVGLNATLRSYQLEGFAWLKYLQMNRFGGCLADDMGLGKTIQTLAFLLWSKQNIRQRIASEMVASAAPTQQSLFQEEEVLVEELDENTPTSLIVMPTSLIHSWKAEVKKFTPNLTIYEHTGINRTRDHHKLGKYDIVLTTYGILRNDIEMLCKFRFYYVIMDESQMIKNPDSKGYRAALKINTENRLVVTGTPIENSLNDLWAQMNVINRGILGNQKVFDEQFANSLNLGVTAMEEKRLKSIIAPFILRRTKEEVAKDLPAKIENVVYCQMSEEQQAVYEREKEAFRQNIMANLDANGFSRNRMKIFQGLIRLRQAACHPALFDDGFTGNSGKFEEVVRMIDSVVSEGHKVLVFSSFVKHLRLVESEIKNLEIPYLMLTGSSTNREELVKNFQNNENVKVFLISLKAGGFGLNLTAADYVFLLDPWWNPASENQALDRAHRIGQDRKVFAYRFITSGSIEEKILILQEKKSKLAETFINNNNPLKDLNRDLLESLLG